MRLRNFLMFGLAALLTFTAGAVLAGNLVIKGSTTVLPISQKVGEAYMKQHPDVRIYISGGGSGEGIKALIDKSTDIGNSSRFIKSKEVELAVANGAYPVPFVVAYDCIVPVVHPSNSLKGLSMDQLKALYKGEIKNWKEVGGPDRPVVVISRDSSSGTYEVWHKKVMKKERVFAGALLQASNGAVVQAVSKNKNALGYLSLGYVDSSIKALTANGIKGSKETTLNGTYPVSRPLYVFTNGWPKGDALNFINFLVHPDKGQRYVGDAGYVPLY